MMSRTFGAAAVLLAVAGGPAWADSAAVYKEHCAKCHGDTGKADTTIAQAMKVPPLAGDANVQKMSTEEIAKRIMENEKHPPTVKGLSADDINAAAAAVKQIAAGK